MKRKYILWNTQTQEETGVALIEAHQAEQENKRLSHLISPLRWETPAFIEGFHAYKQGAPRTQNPYGVNARLTYKTFVKMVSAAESGLQTSFNQWEDGWMTARNIDLKEGMSTKP